MATVIGGMTMSLDGFVADEHGDSGALYQDLAALHGTDYLDAMIAETGAVVMGRRSFEMPDDPDSIADAYEFQVPLFIVTTHPPARHPRENDRLTFTFVTDGPESAVRRAKAAAGDRAVQIVGGARLGEQLLVAGLVDEIRVDVMPVFLGAGTRLFDDPRLAGVTLERIEVTEIGPRTSLRFRVLR
ncbi:dihydrofolate reductase family protein [Krasilnikovia sp. MM14-A1259]|uniref:dihydrofolate reductase family protein n=1 Tax=Krasilnikovia sp. MM14-A1259 TaxID=3373539 RepID=UPI00399D4D10